MPAVLASRVLVGALVVALVAAPVRADAVDAGPSAGVAPDLTGLEDVAVDDEEVFAEDDAAEPGSVDGGPVGPAAAPGAAAPADDGAWMWTLGVAAGVGGVLLLATVVAVAVLVVVRPDPSSLVPIDGRPDGE